MQVGWRARSSPGQPPPGTQPPITWVSASFWNCHRSGWKYFQGRTCGVWLLYVTKGGSSDAAGPLLQAPTGWRAPLEHHSPAETGTSAGQVCTAVSVVRHLKA